jgi:two-component system sensor histidine kinase RegB
VAPGVPAVAVQPRALEQALALLVGNAIDAMEGRPNVVLRIGHEAGKVSFAVTDRGPGMPPEVLRQAENPFFTTKPPGKGMGLGLFLVRLTAERNDGTFVIDSRPGAGTTAVLTLPAASG